MKLTKNKLKEIIREEVQKLNEFELGDETITTKEYKESKKIIAEEIDFMMKELAEEIVEKVDVRIGHADDLWGNEWYRIDKKDQKKYETLLKKYIGADMFKKWDKQAKNDIED
mgnify:CR=1 FL=1